MQHFFFSEEGNASSLLSPRRIPLIQWPLLLRGTLWPDPFNGATADSARTGPLLGRRGARLSVVQAISAGDQARTVGVPPWGCGLGPQTSRSLRFLLHDGSPRDQLLGQVPLELFRLSMGQGAVDGPARGRGLPVPRRQGGGDQRAAPPRFPSKQWHQCFLPKAMKLSLQTITCDIL